MKASLLLSVLFILCLCCSNIAWLPCALSAEESAEYKETIYVNVFFGFPYGEELILVKNTDFLFENMIDGPPINTDLTVFNDGFRKLKCDLVSTGNSSFISFNIYFDSLTDNSTAYSYTNGIVQEFLAVFGYHNLELLWENSDFKEGMLWVHKSFGYIPYTETVTSFLKYKPSAGFAAFVDRFVLKNISAKTLLPSYTLQRIGANFYWALEILATENEQLSLDLRGYLSTINVKELLNADLPLVEYPSKNQQIIILIEKNKTLEIGHELVTYTIDIERVEPDGYTIGSSADWPNYVEIRYEPLFSIENIIVEVKIESHTGTQAPFWIWFVASIIVLTTILILFYFKKKIKAVEKHDGKRKMV